MSTTELSIIEEHAEEAAFLWQRRDAATGDLDYDLNDLCELDERLAAHLDGLRLAGDAGVKAARAGLSRPGPGEAFTAAALAIARREARALAFVLDAAAGDEESARGVAAALGWAPLDSVTLFFKGLLDDRCPPELKYLGIAGSAAHRFDPGAALPRAIAANDARLSARALIAVGELGRDDLRPEVRAALGSDDEGRRFAAAFSAALLGDASATPVLVAITESGGAYAERAAEMAARRMDAAAARAWIRSLGPTRAAVRGAGASGDADLIPWLLERMAEARLARLAAMSYALLTGADMRADKLVTKPPAGFVSGPTDDPDDDDVAMDPDEGLPWPDVASIQSHWSKRRGAFRSGQRYLSGKPIEASWLASVLRSGSQPARAAAAIELRSLRGRGPLFNVRAPGERQRREVGA